MILIIDNYDSFVYNLAQYCGELGWKPVVYRNNRINLEEIEDLQPSHIIISPGPRTPLEAGVSNDVIRWFGGRTPLLGVCLGHQCIGHVHGMQVVRAPVPTHGKSSPIYHDGKTVYRDLPNPLTGGRYHSLVLQQEGMPGNMVVTAKSADGVVMGVRHKKYVIEGVQFHPESIMTETGHALLSNFLNFRKAIWPEE